MDTTSPRGDDCLNCGARIAGDYCPRCGQATATGRLQVGAIVRDALSHVANLDSTALRTVLDLTRAPGRVCRDYVDGKRVGYVAPLRYCVTLVALYLLVNLLVGFDATDVATGVTPGLTAAQAQVRDIIASFMTRHFDWVLFAMLPAFVLVVRVLFRGRGYNYAEVSVFVLYVVGHVALVRLPLAPFKTTVPLALVPVALLLQIGFFAWAAVTFFDVSVAASIVKSVVATLVYILLIMVTVTLFVLPQLIAVFRGT